MCAQLLGWVDTGLCRKYSQAAGDSAAAALPPPPEEGGGLRWGDPPGEPGSPGSVGRAAVHGLCARALKLAAQYHRSGDSQQVRGAALRAGA